MERLREIPFQTYRNEIFRRLGEISKVVNLSERERQQYNDYLKWSRDYHAELDYERTEGRKEGRTEEKKELVAKFKALGVDVVTISKATGLSAEEIAAL